MNLDEWYKSFLKHFTIVAIKNEIVVGFWDIDNTGYLDKLYVHKEYQRQGIATAICDELEKAVKGKKIITQASITAKPFFEHGGIEPLSNNRL